MNVARLIGMLGLKASSVEPRVSGLGDITREDVMLACGGMPREPWLLVRAAWLHESSSLYELTGRLMEIVQNMAADEHWVLPRPNFLYSICNTALREAINPPLCPNCGGYGRKLDRISNKTVDCRMCEGSGTRALRDTELRRRLGLSSKTWKTVWRRRYGGVKSIVYEWNNDAWDWISKRLRGREVH